MNDDLCIPCLKLECVEKMPNLTLDKNEDDWCDICVSAGLGMMPCVQLSCKHVFHEDCLMKILTNKWSGPRINFKFLDCPACNK